MLRLVRALLATFLLAVVTPATASPNTQSSGETVVIPFDPPLAESVRYRWETSEVKDGKFEMSWSVDDYRFEETKDGYRLTVVPISAGSNEDDPAKREFLKMLEELTDLPFVLRLNEDAEIVELERGDEYWSKIIQALRAGLSKMEPKQPGHEKMVEAVVGLFEDMPAETRLAKLTEPVQPMIEFAWTETSVGNPVLTAIETSSPLGQVKQEVAITLTRVSDGFAHLTIRSTIPSAEMKKLTASMLDRLNNGAMKAQQVTEMKAALAAAKDFKSETVSDYKISLEDGLLESFHSTQTVTATEDGEPRSRVKTATLKRIY